MSRSVATKICIVLGLVAAVGFVALMIGINRTRKADQAAAALAAVTAARQQSAAAVKEPEAFVGVETAPLFSDPQMANGAGQLELGTMVYVREVRECAVRIGVGRFHGWARRCDLCTAAELEKRKANGCVPQKIVCVGHELQHFLYGGSLPRPGGRVSLEAGRGLWLDGTTAGKPLQLACGATLTGEPDKLFCRKADGTIAPLAILPYTPTEEQRAADEAHHKAVQERVARHLVARVKAEAQEAARRQTERELLVLRLLRPRGHAEAHGRTAGLAELPLRSLLGELQAARERLDQLRPEHALLFLPDMVRDLARNPYIESVSLSVGGNVPLALVKQHLGEEQNREGPEGEATVETTAADTGSASRPRALTWYSYGWLQFGVSARTVVAVRALVRRVPEAVAGVRVPAPVDLPPPPAASKTIVTTEKAPPKPGPAATKPR
jgi:hypothetical protein